MTGGLALEPAPNIRVNAVMPVSSPTGFDLRATGMAELTKEVNAAVIQGIPMGRRATPQDVAKAVTEVEAEAFIVPMQAELRKR
jgi:3-oxoacyl-[acyl-carrier protein] reductase